jgi:hypothetical protein
MGCNCGGNFQIDDGAVEMAPPAPGDASYFWNGGVTSTQAEGALVAPNGTPVWNADTAKTETEAD